MSPTPTQKTLEAKKSLCNQVSDVESEKIETVEADLILDSTSRSTGGAGETPVKKLLKKSKIEDDKSGKNINSPVIDKVPKKNAQRAKGSISLNKTIEKASTEFTEKKRLAFDSSDSVSTVKEEDNVENTKSGMDGRRTPVSIRNKGSKTKTTSKKPAKKDSKDSKLKTQKPWMDAEEKLSNNALEKKIAAETIAKEDFAEVQNTEIRSLNPPFATCSFFEKLQQGVKSYFSSKNSFTPYDKNKKEGGSRNSASVENGVKEDTKKKDPGLILKNDIYNSKSDLYHDELRSDSNLGGHSNNFSNDKPKIFRKLKRKKLYHPKKHYVRIQIPRKGYFYRSTIQFKIPGSSASGQFKRLEPHDVPKSKSKIQIPGLASTSSKISNLPNKKRLKAKQEKTEENSNVGSVFSDDCLSFDYLDSLSFALHDEKIICNFEQKFNDYSALPWHNKNLHSQEKKKLQLKEDKILELVNSKLEGKKQASALSKKLFKCYSQKSIDRVKKKSLNMENKFSEILDISERVLPTFKKQNRTSESTFETLISCINSILGNDKLFCDLEITPVNSVEEDLSKTYTDPSNSQGISEIPLQFTEIISAFNNFNDSTIVDNSTNFETLYLSPISSTAFYHPDIKPGTSLMEEIDLHLELLNYLKGYNNFTKNKTKSTEESNFNSSADCQNEKNKFSEVRESKSSSSFASATSNGSFEDEKENQFRIFLDCRHDMKSLSEECMRFRLPKTFNLQTKFTDESREFRKIKSENNPRVLTQDSKLNSSIKRTFGKTSFHWLLLDDKENTILRHSSSLSKDFSTEDSTDSYEKITPFDLRSNKSCDDTKTRNKSHVLFENRVYSFSAESMAQRIWKVASDVNHSETKSSNNFKIIKPVQSESNKDPPASEVILPPSPQPVSNISKWSPTLQDLIDIYNSVLKQSKKIKRNSKNSVNNCFSSHLFTFLNEKLQEKKYKANLIKLSKDFNNNYKPPKWKSLKEKEDSVSLKEYVAMFQEILQSSLSISQITRLNNIISGLQDYSERNCSFFKDLKKVADAEAETKKTVPVIEKAGTLPKMNTIHQPKLVPQTKSKVYFSKEGLNETTKTSDPLNKFSGIRGKKEKKSKSEKMKKEEIHEIELSSPSELECLLKTCFDSVDVFSNDSEKINLKNKLLVTVKVSGNRIFVSHLSCFNNEDALSSLKTEKEGTSELIIENVTSDQVKDASYKPTKINNVKQLKSSHAKKASNEGAIKLEKNKASKARKSQKQKRTKVKEMASRSNFETEHLLQHQNRSSETIFPFEYDQMQLRAQHPIEAIIESSESKISEIFENSNKNKSELSSMTKILLLKENKKDSTITKEALKDALAENVFTKDLICNFDWSEEEIGKTLGPIKSYVIRRQTAKKRVAPLAKKKQIPEIVRSMYDLNTKTRKNRKGRKALPGRLRETYLCYPFLHNFQLKTSKSIQKSKEKIKDKNLVFAPPRPGARNIVQPIKKSEIHKKVSELFGFNRQKSENTAVASQTSASNATPTKAMVNQSSSNTTICLSKECISDGCSNELLLSENIKDFIALSVLDFFAKQDLSVQTASEQFPCQIQTEVIKSNHSSETSLNRAKDSPIVLHTAKNDIDDFSFPSVIIHSDSFLKCFSGFAVTRSKLNSLFKSNSDMEFYPENIPQQRSETKPFITFVLAPKQKKMAGLSFDKNQIVTKSDANSSAAASTHSPAPVAHSNKQERKTPKVKLNESSDKISFQSIEKFREISDFRNTAVTSKKFQEYSQKNKQNSSSCNRKKKSLIPNQISPTKHGVERKVYHECQKRKKVSARIDLEVKKTAKMSEKLKENRKKIKIIEKKGESEKSHGFFPNEVKDFIKIENNSNVEKRESKKCEENEKNMTAEEVDFNKKGFKTVPDDVIKTITEKSLITDISVATETEETPIGNSTKELLNSSNFLQKLLETLQTTLIQAEDFRNKAEIISTIEKKLGEKKPKLCEEPAPTYENFGNPSFKPKNLKTVKIKIYCSEHKDSVEKKSENSTQNLKTEKTDLLDEVRAGEISGSEQHGQVIKEVNTLNSLVLGGEAKDGDLERQNSTYFDALEKTLPEEDERTGKEMGDIQKMCQRPLEGILDLNAEFGVKEPKSQFYPLLTPSDEKLFFKDCFTKESEEAIIIKITRFLQEDKISYSMALLEEFLKKIENFPDHKDTCFRLRQMLLLIKNKSRNLMSMEKNAWLKLLSLLEEISQTFEDEDIEGSITDNLLMTKAFINKIQALNISRLVDLRNFCYTLSQRPIAKTDGNHMGKIFRKMCESWHFLKQKFTLKPSFICKEEEKFRSYQNRNQDSEPRFKVNSTVSLPQFR